MSQRTWTKEQEEWLANNVCGNSLEYLSTQLNKTCQSVQCKMVRLKLYRGDDRLWTTEQESFLKNNLNKIKLNKLFIKK